MLQRFLCFTAFTFGLAAFNADSYATPLKKEISFFSEALLWQATQGGLEYTQLVSSGKFISVEYDYKWGFRVGADYRLCNDWDLCVDWTRLHTSASSNTTGAQNIIDSSSTLLATAGSYKSSVHWDTLDLDLGRFICLNSNFSVRPHVGLRSAWSNEQNTESFSGVTGGRTATASLYFKNDFWGLGIRAGIDTLWRVYNGLSIYGNAAISLLRGNYNLLSSESGAAPQFSTSNFQANKQITDLQLGLRWDSNLCGYDIAIIAGWEQHFFSNFYQWQLAGLAPTPNGDLGLSGFNFGAQISF